MSQEIEWRTEDTESELRYRYAHETCPDLRSRWHALWLLRQGYTYDGMRNLLDRIGIHPRVPRPLAVPADLAAQEAWQKGGCVKRSVCTKRLAPRGWVGAMSFASGLRAACVASLTPRGMKVRQRVELRRDWYWLAVVVVPRTGVLEAQWMGTLGSEDFLPVLRDWHTAYIDLLVWDGLPGHRGLRPAETAMPTIIQPPASPELNPAERVGELIRAKVEGRIYLTLWHKNDGGRNSAPRVAS